MYFRNIILVFSVVFFASCLKQNNANPVPSISYYDFYAQDENIAYLTINYEDGDGNIFAEEEVKDYNFYAWYEYKDGTGKFVPGLWPLVIPNPPKPDTTIYSERPLAYTVYRPSELSVDQSIKGQITITLVGWRADVSHKNIRYRIYMIDQSGNQTEEITTPDLVIPF
ncbi:MAG: hypothetical protein AB7O73_06740 [Bacteroidia bacterium]